jgi:hypothetical protein
VKRRRVIPLLNPVPPVYPAGVSPLYAFFVPNGGPATGLDRVLGELYMSTIVDDPDDSLYGSSDLYADRHADAWGRAIDMMQFALTCRHASAHINVKELHALLEQYRNDAHLCVGWKQFYGGMGSLECEMHSFFWEPKVRAVALAALVNRPAVARLICPPSIILNIDAIGMLRGKSPQCATLDGEYFVSHPLAWRTDCTIQHPRHLQYYWWLRLTMHFRVPGMGPSYLRACTLSFSMKIILGDLYKPANGHADAKPYLTEAKHLQSGARYVKGPSKTAYIKGRISAALTELGHSQ